MANKCKKNEKVNYFIFDKKCLNYNNIFEDAVPTNYNIVNIIDKVKQLVPNIEPL